MDINNSIKKKK